MTRRKTDFTPEPRLWTLRQVCAYIGRSETWVSQNRQALDLQGFPYPDEFTGLYDRALVDRWIDLKSGVDGWKTVGSNNSPTELERLRATAKQKWIAERRVGDQEKARRR